MAGPLVEPSDMLMLSTLALTGMGTMLLWDALEELFPLSRRFTSSSSVPAKKDVNQQNILIQENIHVHVHLYIYTCIYTCIQVDIPVYIFMLRPCFVGSAHENGKKIVEGMN